MKNLKLVELLTEQFSYIYQNSKFTYYLMHKFHRYEFIFHIYYLKYAKIYGH